MVNHRIKHISIIMDGNGRWAGEKNMNRSYGHRKGIEAVKKIINACLVRQITSLTLFAFSSENWIRPGNEVKLLMSLFRESIINNINDLHENNIHVKFVGDLAKFDKSLIYHMRDLENLTHDNDGMNLNFAVNYGGKWDIAQSVNKYLNENNFNSKSEISVSDIEENLTFYKNHPDLLIRTGGEKRLSNFMLWQHAYTELYFTDCLWPDFNEHELDNAIRFFHSRNRKFGGLKAVHQVENNDK